MGKYVAVGAAVCVAVSLLGVAAYQILPAGGPDFYMAVMAACCAAVLACGIMAACTVKIVDEIRKLGDMLRNSTRGE